MRFPSFPTLVSCQSSATQTKSCHMCWAGTAGGKRGFQANSLGLLPALAENTTTMVTVYADVEVTPIFSKNGNQTKMISLKVDYV